MAGIPTRGMVEGEERGDSLPSVLCVSVLFEFCFCFFFLAMSISITIWKTKSIMFTKKMSLGLNCDIYKIVIHFTRESWGCL